MALIQEVNSIRPDLIEIRYDLIDNNPEEIIEILQKDIRQVATCRPGRFSEEKRLSLLKSAIRAGVSYVDIELESSEVFINEILAESAGYNCSVILSYHNFKTTPQAEELSMIFASCFERGGDVAKIACMVHNDEDVNRLYSLYKSNGRKVILGMGETGKITRIEAISRGSEFTFAAINDHETTAPGQLAYKELIKHINNSTL